MENRSKGLFSVTAFIFGQKCGEKGVKKRKIVQIETLIQGNKNFKQYKRGYFLIG